MTDQLSLDSAVVGGHYYITWPGARTDIMRMAETSASRTARPMMVHDHRSGACCTLGCIVVQPLTDWAGYRHYL